MRRPLTLAIAALAVSVLWGALSAPADAVGDQWAARMLEKINAVRAAAGAPPVSWCPALGESAQQAATNLAKAGVISHDAAGGSSLYERMGVAGYRPRVGGENIAGGYDTVVRVMRGWRTSPGHLATLTDPRYTHVGFAFVETPNRGYNEYWVQHFGTGGRC